MKSFYAAAGCCLLVFLCLFSAESGAQFTPGKLVVTRIGSGAALTSAAFPVSLVQYNTAGTAQTGAVIITMPATSSIVVGAPRALTQSGTATSEGDLSLSADGRYLVLVGYNASTGTASVSSGTAEAVIGRVDANGIGNTLTSLTRSKSYPAASIRSACSLDGSAFWTAGAGSSTTGSIRYVTFGNTNDSGLLISKTISSARVANIYNGQLYASANSGSFRLTTVGTGVPVTSGQVMTNLPGFPTATYDPYAYVLLDMNAAVPGMDVLYVANQGSAATGGLYKYSLVGSSWVANGYIAGNIRGVTAAVNCDGKAELYMTRALNSSAKATRLHAYVDITGYNVSLGNGTINITSTTLLATAATNYAFGGVAFTPLTAAKKPDVTGLSVSAASVCKGSSTNVTMNAPALANGAYTIHYSLSGANTGSGSVASTVYNSSAVFALNAGSIANGGATTITIDSITNPLGCFTASAANAQFTVSDIQVGLQADSIACYGGSTGITVSGSGGVEPYTGTGVFSVQAGSYTYTVSDAIGCSTTVSISVGQPDSLTVSAIKTNVLCNGGNTGTITVTASGGTGPYTYSSNGGASFGGSNVLSNLTTGSYTVAVKDANGCIKVLSPAIVITQPTALSGQYCYNPSAPNAKVLGVRGKGGTAPYTYSMNGTTYAAGNVLGGTAYAFFNRNPGSYTIYIKDANNCVFIKTVNTATLPVCPAAGILPDAPVAEDAVQHLTETLGMQVFPNPSSAAFTVVGYSKANASIEIRVKDAYGKTVLTAHALPAQPYRFGGGLAPGVYLLEMVQGEQRQVLKL